MPSFRSLATALLFCLLAPPAGAQGSVQVKSLYRDIIVYEEGGQRCMKFGNFNVAAQTCMSLHEPEKLVFPYSRLLMGALYLKPEPARVLLIGLGGGTLATALRKILPGAEIDCVELDPAVVEVARTHFGFAAEKFTSVQAQDGRVFVKRAQRQGKRYDLIVLDAFDHVYIPEHMLTKEYFLEVRSLLESDGVFAANTFSSSRLYDAESATYASALGPFFNLKHLNRIVLFRNGGLPEMREVAANAARLEAALRPLGVEKDWLVSLFRTDTSWPAGTRILTDQYSPANLLNGRP